MKRAVTILITIAVCILIASGFCHNQERSSQEIEAAEEASAIDLKEAQSIFPEARSISEADTAFYEVFDKSNSKIGTILHSFPVAQDINGYAGPVPILILLDADNIIVGIKILDNSDTPSYVEKVQKSGMLKRWNGKSISEALATDVDAVSGATFTSRAIDASFRKRIAFFQKENVKIDFAWDLFAKNLASVILLILALYAFFKPAKARKLRIPILILSIIILGVWQGSMLSLFQFYTWLTNGVPLSLQWGLLLITIAAILLPLLTGRAFYCTYLCPFGAAQELMGKANKNKLNISHKVFHYLLFIRKAILIAIVLLLILGINFDFDYIEPFSAFNINTASLITLVIGFASIALSLFISRPWCRICCPLGQTLDFLRKRNNSSEENKAE